MRFGNQFILATTIFSLLLSSVPGLSTSQTQKTSDQKDDVIRISTDLVQTDLTVLDKQGRFVEGLRPEQFDVLVDGKPQTISFFEQVTAGSRREAAIIAGRSGAPNEKGTPTVPGVVDRGRTVFFFIDDFHVSAGSMM